ncbi:NAC domain-containing protein 90-like [Cucumis melo var. makuwa]|nr:NAC domain-containing protein 90-like [Cucumis melo var. makuwa]
MKFKVPMFTIETSLKVLRKRGYSLPGSCAKGTTSNGSSLFLAKKEKRGEAVQAEPPPPATGKPPALLSMSTPPPAKSSDSKRQWSFTKAEPPPVPKPNGRCTSTEQSTIPPRHEFSLCRVYVISGCFRAFDRRPMEVIAAARKNADPKMKGKVTSPEISCSAAAMVHCDGSGSNWRMDEDEKFEESIWEWEKMDWP